MLLPNLGTTRIIPNPDVNSTKELPKSTTVVIIGGGIVGLTAALTLAERNIPVVVVEKGRAGMEQSSRNLGWIRKTNRLANDIPLSLEADKLWAGMKERTGEDIGYRQEGCMFIARNAKEMETYDKWLKSVSHLDLGSRLLSNDEIHKLVPDGKEKFKGAIYTPTDGYSEQTKAPFAIARAAVAKGAVIVENCAARSWETSGGKITSVITEKGEIKCEQVLFAAGLWARRFLGNMGINFTTLPLICSVLKTKPIDIDTKIAVAAPDFSFRKHDDGGFVIMQRGAIDAPMTIDHFKVGHKYMKQLATHGHGLRIGLGRYFFEELGMKRKWSKEDITPFEKIRTMNPDVSQHLLKEALDNLSRAWPKFKDVQIDQVWGGMMDIVPDSNPIIDRYEEIGGLTLAIGFSGHGYGTSPAAGQLAADLVMNEKPLVDPTIYSSKRL